MSFRQRVRKKRRAITPVIATVLMIALTISVAFAAWAWVSSNATKSEGSFNRIAGEKFVIISSAFNAVPPTTASQITIWVYNDGTVMTDLNSLVMSVASVSTGACPMITTITTTQTTTSGTSTTTTTATITSPITYTTTSTAVITTATSSISVQRMASFTLTLNPAVVQGSLITIKAVGQNGFYTSYQVQYC